MNETTPTTAPPKVKRGHSLLGGAITGVLVLVFLELLLRPFGLTHPILYERDNEAGYRLRPDQKVTFSNNTIEVNRWGVRDPRPFDTKTPDVQRVLVLGDSVTWGGIRERQENLFTTRLERLMPNVEVIDAGVNGYSVNQMVALYRGNLRGLAPDLVLVCAIVRDFTRPSKVELRGESALFPTRTPLLGLIPAVTFAQFQIAQRLGIDALVPSGPSVCGGPAMNENQCIEANADALRELAAELGGIAQLLVVLLPDEITPNRSETVARIGHLLDGHRVPWKDLAPTMPLSPEFFIDGVHLSTKGHEAVATALAPLLTPLAAPAPHAAEAAPTAAPAPSQSS